MSNMYDILAKLNSVDNEAKAKEPTTAQVNESKESKSYSGFTNLEKLINESTGDYSAKKAAAGKDIGKPGKGFAKIAKGAAERYGSKAAGERVAGAVLNKLRHTKEDTNEGILDTVKKVGGKVLDTLGHGSDEDMIRDLQKKAGLPQTGKKPTPPTTPGVDEGNAFGQEVRQKKADNIPDSKQKVTTANPDVPLKEKTDKAAFAKLAPPRDKITFADKIAGAKQEVDEMLGDVAAEAMKNAVGKMKMTDEEEDLNPFTNWKKPRTERPKVGSIEHGALHDIEHTATGRKVTRRTDPNTGYSVGSDDTPAAGEKRGKGRPVGSKKSLGAKGPSGKSKLMTRENDHDQSEYDQEGEMAKNQLHTVLRNAKELHNLLGDNDNLPEWVQSKLAKIEGMMKDVSEYMQSEHEQGDGEEELKEKAVSKKQQKFMGMVHAAQKGEKPASKEVAKVAKTMKKSDAKDFASTKQKGLPEKAPKKEKTEESGSSEFGKGVYEGKLAESFNNELTKQLNESMSVNISSDDQGSQGITVTATDTDAVELGQMLKLAGLFGGDGQYKSVCPDCGSSDCGCNEPEQMPPGADADDEVIIGGEEEVDETFANDPNVQTQDTEYMTNTEAGGLNGPKKMYKHNYRGGDNPMAAGQLGEQIETRLFDLYNRYKAN